MTFETLGTRSVTLFLAAFFVACGNGTPEDDTDDTETETEDTFPDDSGPGDDGPLIPTQYTYNIQLGIDADGNMADFKAQGTTFRSALFIKFEDDDERSCTFGYFFNKGGGVVETDETDSTDETDTVSTDETDTVSTDETDTVSTDETDTDTVVMAALISAGDAELQAWLDEQGLIDGVRIADGTYEEIPFLDDENNPCEIAEEYAPLVEDASELFLLDAQQAASNMLVGVGGDLSEDLEEILDNAVTGGQLTAAEKATFSSSYVRLPTSFRLETDGPELFNLEFTTNAAEVNEDMEVQVSGQTFEYIDAGDFDAGGRLATGVYLMEGRVIFGI